ncbi:MAG: ABC transporter permease, partial [Hyphomicrobiales bacterium]|nr:ABC transporter permease [Hyphomicrobiales bacterium]
APPRAPRSVLLDYLADMGAAMRMAGGDVVVGVAFLGRVVATVAAAAARPSRFRRTSVSHHLEQFGVRSVPIIALINFLVGGIVAQQGIFQLASFGAQPFAVDLVGILVLRELGVLLTSIMMAGRSGSAITAEIGSMKMREEIDAIVVMGLDPMETLVAPRAIALALALPLLTFVADMAGLFGGALVAWSYAGIPPVVYFARIKAAIGVSTFLSGLIKAPFMALVIALIATREGLAVGGSAESLGRRVTESVVKAIFMVIVIDGLFAVFFAAIDF